MPVVAQAELLAGVESLPPGNRRDEIRQLYEQAVVAAAQVIGIDSRVGEHFARILVELRRLGRPIDTNDIWIGAIALAHELVVVSSDAHLRVIPGLRVEDWTQPTG